MTRDAAIYVRNLPRDLRDAFSAACRRRGKNMTVVLTEYMRDYVAQKESIQTSKKKGKK